MNSIHMLLMTTLLSASAASAAEETEAPPTEPPQVRRNVVGMSITALQSGALSLEGERVVSPRVSVGLGLRLGLSRWDFLSESSEGPVFGGDTERTHTYLGVDPRVRFFLTGAAPEGLWLSPRLELARRWTNSDGDDPLWTNESKERGWSVGGSAQVGYSVIVGRGLAIQGGVGVEAAYESSRQTYRSTPPLGSGVPVDEGEYRSSAWHVGHRMDVSVGWAF
ncbi:hypothetical protein ACLESO_50995 [Pyxidicoccus sp. 3LG]